MDRTSKIIRIPMLVLACSAVFSANAADTGLKTFAANTPALAEEVNGNFDYINNKIDGLLNRGSTGHADCTSDASALRDLVDKGVNSITFDGACNGPLYPAIWTKITGSGKDTSSINGFLKDSWTTEVIWNRNGYLDIRDTTINSGGLTSDLTMVGSVQGSEIRLKNVDVVGSNNPTDDSLCLMAKQGSFRLTDVKIRACNEALNLSNGSFAEIREDNAGATVIERTHADNWAISLSHNSSLRVKGGTFRGVLDANPDEMIQAIGLNYNSSIRIEGGKIEGLAINRNSSAELRGGEVQDTLSVFHNSYARLRKDFTMTQSATASVKPVVKVGTGIVHIGLNTPLDLSRLSAGNRSLVEISGNGTSDVMSTVNLDFYKGTLNLQAITLNNSDSANFHRGDFYLEQSVLNIGTKITMWDPSSGSVTGGSTVSSASYEGVDCDNSAFQIYVEGGSTNAITYACP